MCISACLDAVIVGAFPYSLTLCQAYLFSQFLTGLWGEKTNTGNPQGPIIGHSKQNVDSLITVTIFKALKNPSLLLL